MMDLSNNEDIIIKEADKGNSIIVMNRTYYIKKVEDHLNQPQKYKKFNRDPNHFTIAKIRSLISKYENIFDKTKNKKERLFLTNFEQKTANFYGKPKIHKSEKIKKKP